MKHPALITIFLFFCLQNIQAQHFNVRIDTIWIPANDYVTPTSTFKMESSAKCRDWYFCFFQQDEINASNLTKKRHLFAISLDGMVVKNVPFPEDRRFPYDIIPRDGELYILDYRGFAPCYHFDFSRWQWDSVPVISDEIYADDDYRVFYKNHGEWGSWTWFEDNFSGRQYLYPNLPTRIVRNYDGYYFLDNRCLFHLSEPTDGFLCDEDIRYDNPNFFTHIARKTYPPIKNINGACLSRSKYEWDWTPVDTFFNNMWIVRDQLFLWTTVGGKSFIFSSDNNTLNEVMVLPGYYDISVRNHNLRGKNQGDNRFLMNFEQDTQTFGLIDVEDSTIKIRYLMHDLDTLHYVGNDNVIPLMRFLLQNIDNLDINMIDSVEKSLNGTYSSIIPPVYTQSYNSRLKYGEDEHYLRKYFYKLVNEGLVVETHYDFHQQDSSVDAFRIDFHKPNSYVAIARRYGSSVEMGEPLYQELKTMLATSFGEPNVVDENQCQWLFDGHTLTLYSSSILWEKE